MKYLGICILLFTVSKLNILGNERFCDETGIIFIQNLTTQQRDEVTRMRAEFLEEFNVIKKKINAIRMETQMEMRKEKPDWNEIKKLNKEYSKLQNTLDKGVNDYRERMHTINIEFIK
ncbi:MULTISPECIES: hypothetical protein [unclassified Fusobacterium]|uniref:hypothetical protein n=1 Tax=unclassified Fusobacterium TaxID=2648384 RepID=UPI002626066C|nr:hypothetical protein [Fusobacterium sp.]